MGVEEAEVRRGQGAKGAGRSAQAEGAVRLEDAGAGAEPERLDCARGPVLEGD